jgi:hypothetical protein
VPDFDYRPPVSHLLEIGVTDPEEEEWPDYLVMGFGSAHVPDLIRLAIDSDLNRAERRRPHLCGPVHAWRTLGLLRATEAVEPLTRLFALVDEQSDEWVVEALPRALGRMGEGALPALVDYLGDVSHGLWARITASASIAEVAKHSQTARGEAISGIRDGLNTYAQNDPTLNAFMIRDLVALQATEAADLIEQAFSARRVNFLVQGDWEDVQVDLGLLEHRLSPRPFRWEPGKKGKLHLRQRTRRGGAAATKQKRKRKQARKARRRSRRR